VPVTRAALRGKFTKEVFASQGSVVDYRSRELSSLEYQHQSFQAMTFAALERRLHSMVLPSITVPGAPNKPPEPTTTSVTSRAEPRQPPSWLIFDVGQKVNDAR
jgi:hypothetical protein